MRTLTSSLLWLTPLCAAFSTCAQGNFQNLDFESAHLPALPTGQYGSVIASSNGFPGWAVSTAVLQNNFTLGMASISILGPNWTASMGQVGLIGGIIEGRYSAVLQAGNAGSSSVFLDASIAQSGLVPADSKSLQIKVYALGGSALTVNFGGQNLPLIALGSSTDYTLYGADITPFAGQVGVLALTASAIPFHFNTVELDSIVFSTQSIPEPSGLALFGIGALFLGIFRRRNSPR